MNSKQYTDKKEIIREIKKPGKVAVFSILQREFNIEKKDAIEFINSTEQDVYLIVWDDGSKRIEVE